MYEHILLPTDGSDIAQAGIDHGLKLACKHGSKVTVVTVTEPLGGQFAFASDLWSPSDEEAAAFDEAQAGIAERILAPVKAKAQALGLAVETLHVPWRRVAGALVDAACERGCSLIVMSSHGRTGMNRIMLGSQTAEVLATSGVPVLVVRQPSA
ncbi:MAG: universal stress protein UspA [Hyphomicrobiales bacterium]|nr:MAG: universal stress protein UspA [Hyphomicrobiales bacterium]